MLKALNCRIRYLKFLIVLVGFLTLSGMTATATTAKALVLYPNNSEEIVLFLKEHPAFSFVGTTLMVETSSVRAELQLSNMGTMKFEDRIDYGTSSATSPNKSQLNINLTNPNVVSIVGLDAYEEIQVFLISGRLLARHKADMKGEVEVSLEGLAKGDIIIIRSSSSAIKLIKK